MGEFGSLKWQAANKISQSKASPTTGKKHDEITKILQHVVRKPGKAEREPELPK